MGVRAGCYFLLSLVFIGCATAKFTVAPPAPDPAQDIQKADYSSLVVNLEALEVFKVRESKTTLGWGWEKPPDRDETSGESGWYPARLSSTWASYLNAYNQFGEVQESWEAVDREPDLTLRTRAWVRSLGSRTYYLDSLVLPSFFFMPLTPEWGKVGVLLDVEAVDPNGEELFKHSVFITAPYDMLFYSWFRTGPTEEALKRAYAEAFRQSAVAFADEQDEILARLQRGRETPLVSPGPPAESIRSVRSDFTGSEPLRYRLENDHRVYVVQDAKARKENRGFLMSYLGALGGVRATVIQGIAEVSSSVTEESGEKTVVASGDATNTGYRISLYSVPKSTGFFIYPTFDWMEQRIDIADFQEAVPIVDVAGEDEIAGVFTDPGTQQSIDITDPNSYQLNLRSTALGQRMGLDFVLAVPRVEFFTTFEGGVGILERRRADVRLGALRQVGSQWIWLGSYVAAGRAGFTIPRWHFSVSGTGEYRLYPEFAYPNPVEFRGQSRFKPEKNIYEQPRSFVGAAKLETLDLTLSLSYVF